MRGVFAAVWCVLALLASGSWRRVGGAAHPQVMVRGLLEAAAAFVYLIALPHIPFAIATAVNMSTPLILTVLAVLVLKEDVRWRRWTAVIAGFLGVLLVIQPRPGDINAWTWTVLAAAIIGAVRDVLSRFVPVSVPSLVVSLTTAAMVAVIGCAWSMLEGWQPMSWAVIGFLLASSLLLASGYQLPDAGAAVGCGVLGHRIVPLRLGAVGDRHRLRRVGRRAERAGAAGHCRDRGVWPLHPAPRALEALIPADALQRATHLS